MFVPMSFFALVFVFVFALMFALALMFVFALVFVVVVVFALVFVFVFAPVFVTSLDEIDPFANGDHLDVCFVVTQARNEITDPRLKAVSPVDE
jgi:asparagine N-glycosylation enzyme membrane subunit Stt3